MVSGRRLRRSGMLVPVPQTDARTRFGALVSLTVSGIAKMLSLLGFTCFISARRNGDYHFNDILDVQIAVSQIELKSWAHHH